MSCGGISPLAKRSICDRSFNKMKPGKDETQLRELIDGWLQAVRAKDVDGAMSGYSPDVLVFDVVNPLRKFGAAALRKRVEDWFSAFRGPIGYEMRNLEVACASDLAFCHSVNHIRGAKIDGGEINIADIPDPTPPEYSPAASTGPAVRARRDALLAQLADVPVLLVRHVPELDRVLRV
jgi:ketosteroid isomerase-like protein